MEKKHADRPAVMVALEHAGGTRPGAARAVSRETGVPEADVYGVATFYDLLARPDVELRICQGTSCAMAGAHERLADMRAFVTTARAQTRELIRTLDDD